MKIEYLTTCGICGRTFKSYPGFSKHLPQAHPGVSNRSYYDEYMRESGEGACAVCGAPTGFTKKLVEAGFPEDRTEHEIMLSRGIYRIYDCGNWKYVWNRE